MGISFISWSFIVKGIIELSISQWSCNSLCSVCNYQQLKPCYFLLVFVGIILIVVGLSLRLLYPEKKLPKVKLKKERKINKW